MNWRNKLAQPEYFIFILAAASALSFAAWNTLLNNFVIERAAFTGKEIGILQSLREVPGFLAFTTIFVLLIIREQSFALIGIALLGLGVAITGYLPTAYGLYFRPPTLGGTLLSNQRVRFLPPAPLSG